MNFIDRRHRNKLTGDRMHTRTAGLLLGVPLTMLLSSLSIVETARAETKQPAIATTDARHAALLAEVRKNLAQTGKYSAAQMDGVIAELRNKSMDEIRAMADFAGKGATGAERLLPGSGSDARDRAGELTGRSGIGSADGPASQRGINQALTPGMNDKRGQASSGCDACDAAPKEGALDWLFGSKQRNGAEQLDKGPPPKHDNATRFTGTNGDTIDVFPDKSASIARRDGSTEYINRHQRLVDRNGNAKEPRPDGDKSGGFTAADVRRVAALLGQHSQPAGNDDTGGGGPVDSGKTDPTGSRGLYTETRLGAGYVSEADLKEILRVAIEKVGGPIGR